MYSLYSVCVLKAYEWAPNFAQGTEVQGVPPNLLLLQEEAYGGPLMWNRPPPEQPPSPRPFLWQGEERDAKKAPDLAIYATTSQARVQ